MLSVVGSVWGRLENLKFEIEEGHVKNLGYGWQTYNPTKAWILNKHINNISSVQSVGQAWLTLCDPMDCNTPGLPVHHQLQDLAQTHVHRVGDATQPSHPLSSPSPPAFNCSQHQGLFQLVSSSHQVARVLEFQLQHQSFQWIFRTDFLKDHISFT